ncbi:MAG: hypothetical protein LUG13_03200 [Oscillospiraceae bacterium]|nr:hypothetical protein [Oscillospiraceae bacterium]
MKNQNDHALSIREFESALRAKNELTAVRLLLSYPLVNWVSQYFSRTRAADRQLDFINLCRSIIDRHREKLADAEYEHFDRYLLLSKLAAFDRLNLFYEYIKLFEYIREHYTYSIRYSQTKKGAVFDSYIIVPEDIATQLVPEGAKTFAPTYTHFLYPAHRRYEVIKRKYDRMKSDQHVQARAQAEDLPDSERARRQFEMEVLLNHFVERFSQHNE